MKIFVKNSEIGFTRFDSGGPASEAVEKIAPQFLG